MFDNFYGLSGKPFQLTPDPEFYFRSITHRKALSYLGYGLAQGEGFIVITGEIGSGKSTLVAHMMQSIDRNAVTVAQIVTSKLDEEEVVHVVAGAMGLDVEGHDKATALSEIENYLHDEARAGRRCLLVVDESQNLSVQALEELRMFSNFQLGSHPLLQTLLLGQPEFRTTLQGDPGLEQLRQRVIAAHHLEPMQKDEIEPYMIHRLKKVGWDGNPAFDHGVFAQLHEISGGIPRRVNQIANRLLLLGAVEERSRIDAGMLHAVLSEMEAEAAFPETPKSPPQPEPAAIAPTNAAPVASGVDQAAFEAALAARDAQIADLERAVIQLYDQMNKSEAARPDTDAMREELAAVEARVFEQERSIRQTVTMLIEWIEGQMDSSRAA